MREKKIENQIKKYLEAKNIYYFKHHGNKYSQVGVPDLVVCYKGKFIGLEVKAENGKPSPLQYYNLKMINENGGIGLIVKSLEEVKELIENI